MRARVMPALVAALALSGCKAKPPGRFEHAVVTSAKHHLFIGNKKQKNPLQTSAENIEEGKQAFNAYCNVCHGNDGQNTGVPFADHISPPIPLLNSEEVQSYTDGQLKRILNDGIWPSGMPGSAGTLSDDEQWAIVLYLRHLPPKGSQGMPKAYQ